MLNPEKIWLFALSEKKTNCYSLTHHTWKISPHYLVKCTTFHLTEGMLHSFKCWRLWKKTQLWAGIDGSEKNWLWYAANGMSGKQRYSKCSNWPPSAWIHASCSLFRNLTNCIVHHALLKFSPCRNKTLLQFVRIADWYLIRVKKWKKHEKFMHFTSYSVVTSFRCENA